VQSLIQEGRLDALATTSRKRVSALPNVPTTIEAGYPDSDFDFWVGMFVPSKTPRDIVEKLYAEARKAAELPELRAQMAAIGGEPMEAMTPVVRRLRAQGDRAQRGDRQGRGDHAQLRRLPCAGRARYGRSR